MKTKYHLLPQSPHSSLLCLVGSLTLALVLVLFSAPTHSAEVTLAWDANTETNLSGYKVYYKTASSGQPYNGTGANQGSSPVTVPLQDLANPNNPEYTLSSLEDNKAYYYVVTAYNDEAMESDYSNEVGNIAIPLQKGWNLLSLCRQPVDADIASVLSPISSKYESVWSFIDNDWKAYEPANPGFNDLTHIETGMGYWANITQSTTLSTCISASAPSSSIDLLSGWNLVGYNASSPESISDAMSSIESKFVSLRAFIGGVWRVYDPAYPALSDLTLMEPGYAYWIKASEACTWALP